MSTTCVDFCDVPALDAEVGPSEQACKELRPLRDVDLSLRDDSGFVHLTLAGQRSTTGTGSDAGGQGLLLRVAERLEPTDARLAREVYLEALTLEMSRGPGSSFGVSAVCKAAQAAPPVPGSPQATDLALDGLIKRCTEGYAAALPQLREALDAFDAWDDRTDHGPWGQLMTCIAMDLWDDRRLARHGDEANGRRRGSRTG